MVGREVRLTTSSARRRTIRSRLADRERQKAPCRRVNGTTCDLGVLHDLRPGARSSRSAALRVAVGINAAAPDAVRCRAWMAGQVKEGVRVSWAATGPGGWMEHQQQTESRYGWGHGSPSWSTTERLVMMSSRGNSRSGRRSAALRKYSILADGPPRRLHCRSALGQDRGLPVLEASGVGQGMP